MLPNFIVIGQAKCGTTSLCELLKGHPEIFFSEPKEPRYFSNERNYGDRFLLTNYEDLFSGVTDHKAIGEGSTNYSHPRVAELAANRIADCIPHCKIIFSVRHPLRRLESDWRMRVFERWADKDINDAIRSNPSLISHSLYWKNFKPYTQRFPETQRLVVFLEDFADNPNAELKRCFKFVSVDTEHLFENSGVKRNQSRDFRNDTWLLSQLRKSNALDKLKQVIPDGARRWGKRLLAEEQRYSLNWHTEFRREVVTQLRDDSDVFLALHGKPSDYWDFSDDC